jgi:hypothetical protein
VTLTYEIAGSEYVPQVALLVCAEEGVPEKTPAHTWLTAHYELLVLGRKARCKFYCLCSLAAYTRTMSEHPQREGKAEKASRWLRNAHYAGAVALGGAALVFPGAAAPLVAFGAWEAAHGAVWEAIRGKTKPKKKR